MWLKLFRQSINYKYILVGIVLLIISGKLALSFAPPPEDTTISTLCKATNGTVNITYVKPDCGPGCDAAIKTVTGCNCPSDSVWNSSVGCISKPVERQNIFIEIINSFIDFIYRLFGLK